MDIFKAEKAGNMRKFPEVIFSACQTSALATCCNPAGERMERQSGGLLPKAERYERVNRNEQCDRSKGAVRRLRLRNANRKESENPQEKQNPGSIDLQCPGESKWRDYRASLARNLNRRDCPPGRSLVSVEKAADEISSTGGRRRLSPRPYRPRVRIPATDKQKSG